MRHRPLSNKARHGRRLLRLIGRGTAPAKPREGDLKAAIGMSRGAPFPEIQSRDHSEPYH
jgi:hypothetical protein